MYKLFGIPTQNTFKAAYVLDAIGVDYEYKTVDLANGEQKGEEFLKINPVGKVPALKHNDFSMFESGAICRYVANAENSSLYPQDKIKRARNDQWLDFFSCHLGRWLSVIFFEKVMKRMMGRGEANAEKCAEALDFVNQQATVVEKHLGQSTYLTGPDLSIADYAAYAYLEQMTEIQYDLTHYPKLKNWLDKMSQLDSVKKTKSKIKF